MELQYVTVRKGLSHTSGCPASLTLHASKCSVKLEGQISLEMRKQTGSYSLSDLPQVKQQLWVRLKSF